jgi:DMSO/TMAO reductase YedYZ molybdopterin-dependent catalytic subunit
MSTAISRRNVLRGTVAFAALAFARRPLSVFGFGEPEAGATPVPFLAPQPKNPNRPMVQWEELKSWVTPNENVYVVSHYGNPAVDATQWKLEIGGLVTKPRTFTLAELQQRPQREVTATIECGGNGSSAAFMGAVANVRWKGTPLAPLLQECGLQPRGIEVVFFGADQKKEKIREQEYDVRFSRSLSVSDALQEKLMLCWEMNGQPLSKEHGFPLRLIVPGWYGIAWVKWLSRIEVWDRRFMSRFMGRDYVTIRGEEHDGHILYNETSVTWMNVKSIVARVLRLKDGTVRLQGAAWGDGTPIQKVEVKLDDGPWVAATLDAANQSKYCWTFWSYDWKGAAAGEHTLVSRAIDAEGRVQPAPEDPAIKLKKTYWEANQQWVRKIKL